MSGKFALWVLLIGYAALGVVYTFSTPMFEAPDEAYHFALVDHLASGGGLPDQRIPERRLWKQEGSQPPLFYMLAAQVVSPFQYPFEELRAALVRNPYAYLGDPASTGLGNRNYAVHEGAYPPFGRLSMAFYAARLLNVAFGALTVFALYRAASVILNPAQAWAAAALAAFNPQFLFIAAAVNNDILIAALGSLILWQTLVMLRDGFRTCRSLSLALLVALAALTKLSGLLFGGLVGLAALWVIYQRRDWRGLLRLALFGLTAWALIAGWWYWRNLTMYGDLTGTHHMLLIIGRRPAPPLVALLVELLSLTDSFWGVFGWFNILPPALYQHTVDLLLILAGVGLLIRATRHRDDNLMQAQIGLLGLTALAGLGALIVWTLQTHGTQGRLLFPYIAAWNILIVVGLSELRIPLRPLMIGLATCAALFAPLVIAPQYAVAAPLDVLPPDAVPFSVSWEGEIEIVGHAKLDAGRYHAGDLVPVTVYWRPLIQSPRPRSLYLHLIAPDAEIIGQVTSYPGAGMRQATTWDAGKIYPDTYLIPLTEAVSGAFELRLQMGWLRANGQTMQAFDPSQNPATYVIVPAGRYENP